MCRIASVLSLSLCTVLLTVAACGHEPGLDDDEGGPYVKRKSGWVDPDVARAAVPGETFVQAPSASGFSPQTRLGFTAGDQWEPSLAADRSGNVYVLYPQYFGVPGCPDCPSPTLILQISRDGGATWGAPHLISPPGTGQVDAQIAVDPADGRTVYAAWLQNGKSDTVVARSDDLGTTWSLVVASRTNAGTDKPILAVRGPDVYVAYNHAQKVYVSSSHDGGRRFVESTINANGKLGWSLAGGGTVDPSGQVFFSWAGYEQSGGAKGRVHLYVSASRDGGATWALSELDTSESPPDCSAYLCGWAYLGAQIAMASDAAGNLYALWNAGDQARGPERIWFASSIDGGRSWGPAADVSSAAAGVAHAFPAIAAGAEGDVRIAWMDARYAGLWNTWTRGSTDRGATFGPEVDLSTFVDGYPYIQPEGFSFPFGDYFEMDIDADGQTHAVWGEGLNYDSPGSIWYARGR